MLCEYMNTEAESTEGLPSAGSFLTQGLGLLTGGAAAGSPTALSSGTAGTRFGPQPQPQSFNRFPTTTSQFSQPQQFQGPSFQPQFGQQPQRPQFHQSQFQPQPASPASEGIFGGSFLSDLAGVLLGRRRRRRGKRQTNTQVCYYSCGIICTLLQNRLSIYIYRVTSSGFSRRQEWTTWTCFPTWEPPWSATPPGDLRPRGDARRVRDYRQNAQQVQISCLNYQQRTKFSRSGLILIFFFPLFSQIPTPSWTTSTTTMAASSTRLSQASMTRSVLSSAPSWPTPSEDQTLSLPPHPRLRLLLRRRLEVCSGRQTTCWPQLWSRELARGCKTISNLRRKSNKNNRVLLYVVKLCFYRFLVTNT